MLLLDNGANVSNKEDMIWRYGTSSCWGKDEAVNLLLKRGAHLHVKNYDKHTLLDVAKHNNKFENPLLLPSSNRGGHESDSEFYH